MKKSKYRYIVCIENIDFDSYLLNKKSAQIHRNFNYKFIGNNKSFHIDDASILALEGKDNGIIQTDFED